MATGKNTINKNGDDQLSKVSDYRHLTATRKNNPPAKLAAEGVVPILPKTEYSYSPRRPPELLFDPYASVDQLPELLAEAKQRPLTNEEVLKLAEALRNHDPWLEWAGKREKRSFKVDPVALHIHERISAQAILKVAARQDLQRELFVDPQQTYHESVQFYQWDIKWTNRLILGDGLQVMSSLARREDLAGKVQMIYIDPPYGIKFASNFQPEVGKRDVKDKETDLTREPEMVKAFRDTWNLGIHSYLSYLRDRLVVAKELLTDSGSIFVQIGDENLHRVRNLLDEVFGNENFIGFIAFKKKKMPLREKYIFTMCDYLLWYGKDANKLKYRKLYLNRDSSAEGDFQYVESEKGEIQSLSHTDESFGERDIQFQSMDMRSSGRTESCVFPFEFEGRIFNPSGGKSWKTNYDGMKRLSLSGRLFAPGDALRYKLCLSDYPVQELSHMWMDTQGATDKDYVVQTSTTVLERCILMTTDPGDLVLDPTCGSGTTAYVAEQWGRRWITMDTSRVALAIARQRLLTAKFDYLKLRAVAPTEMERNRNNNWLSDPEKKIEGPCTFKSKTFPHITVKSIAQNINLDPIFARHEPILDEALAACNLALNRVNDELRAKLRSKMLAKYKAEGRKAISKADRRRWELPKKTEPWQHWEVPFDTDPDYPHDLAKAITEYREAWRVKMDEVNACITANAEQEEIVDQPEAVRGVVRVSGPFTVEAVQPPEMSLGDVIEMEFEGSPEKLDTFAQEDIPGVAVRMVETHADQETRNIEAYIDNMIRLLRTDGVRFPNNKQMKFTRLDPLTGNAGFLHAEGRWVPTGETDSDQEGRATLCVTFGPQYGPVTSVQVVEAMRSAIRAAYDEIVIAGFSFDAAAQSEIEEYQNPRLRVHLAHIRPDVNPAMEGLLKEQPGSQLFTVFGQPRTLLRGPNAEGEYTVTVEGVDIYNPVDNSITATGANKVAAWFIDSNYDGKTFCITQAFFPDRKAWGKLSNALKDVIDPDRFEAFSGITSLPFPIGENKSVAVKVIDPRGNEVIRIHKLS